MGVYNGAANLRDSLESILTQEGADLEFIVVNDGSTDESGKILDEYAARDGRVRVIHQENRGLTAALISGCAAARGRFIARQDAGDLSMKGRLREELSYALAHDDAALVSCGTRFVGPAGEHLYDVLQNDGDADEGLKTLDRKEARGPSHHGCTLFPKALYEGVGGYRSAFYYGQDLDLWLRFAEHGRHYVVPAILYQGTITAGSLSGLFRKEQDQLTAIMIEAADLRRKGKSEDPALERARGVGQGGKKRAGRIAYARANYFIGACLRKRGDRRAGNYFKEALRMFPLHARSWYGLIVGR